VLGYAGAALVEPACALTPVTSGMVDDHGLVADDDVRTAIAGVIDALVAHAR
jgi:hypothetical protein